MENERLENEYYRLIQGLSSLSDNELVRLCSDNNEILKLCMDDYRLNGRIVRILSLANFSLSSGESSETFCPISPRLSRLPSPRVRSPRGISPRAVSPVRLERLPGYQSYSEGSEFQRSTISPRVRSQPRSPRGISPRAISPIRSQARSPTRSVRGISPIRASLPTMRPLSPTRLSPEPIRLPTRSQRSPRAVSPVRATSRTLPVIQPIQPIQPAQLPTVMALPPIRQTLGSPRDLTGTYYNPPLPTTPLIPGIPSPTTPSGFSVSSPSR